MIHFIIALSAVACNAAPTETLVQMSAAVDREVTLPCRTNLSVSVDWRYHKSPFDTPQMIYSNDQLYGAYDTRMAVARPTVYDYSLTILSAQTNDSGLYTCTEDGGLGTRHTISLVVTDSADGTKSDGVFGQQSLLIILVSVTLGIVAVLAVAFFIYVVFKHRQKNFTGESLPRHTESGKRTAKSSSAEKTSATKRESTEAPLLSPVQSSSTENTSATKREQTEVPLLSPSQQPAPSEEPIKIPTGIDKQVRQLNILIVGETGVGKSTWINGFTNYLKFPTLAAAVKAGGLFPLSVHHMYRDPKTNEEKLITAGEQDDNEKHGSGQSVTQHPTQYQFVVGDIHINLIDTPGMSDTRGKEQDTKNIGFILEHITSFQDLHAICILLKANQARLTESFKYCLTQIFHNLHDSACRNVVFVITNTKATDYQPGDTLTTLKQFLATDQRLSEIKVDQNTIYCMDNEAVRFLAEQINDIRHHADVRRTNEKSWEVSVEVSNRLLKYCLSLIPHKVADMLSLANARRVIELLSAPLIEVAELCARNIISLKQAEGRIRNTDASVREADGTVTLITYVARTEQVSPSLYVCTGYGCYKTEHGEIMYPRQCPLPSEDGVVTRIFRWFSGSERTCDTCGHEYSKHKHECTRTVIEEKRESVNLRQIQDRTSQFNMEQTKMIETCAALSIFLKQHAMCGDETSADVLTANLRKQISQLKGNKGTSQNQDEETTLKLNHLENLLTGIDSKSKSLELQNKKYDAEDADRMIKDLYALPIAGPQLSNAELQIQEAVRSHVQSCSKTVNCKPHKKWLKSTDQHTSSGRRFGWFGRT